MTSLNRAVGLPGAVLMGMGSIVGTGVFVSLGLAAGLAGNSMILALLFAGVLAVCNGLSTAQLAAAHPVSGGTYEYGYEYLNPWLGYLAGWLFLCAKSASAATAAIGFGGYAIQMFQLEGVEPWQIGILGALSMIAITLLGIRRSSVSNTIIVTLTLTALAGYVFVLGPEIQFDRLMPFWRQNPDQAASLSGFFESIALLFVAYTGYGRIATLGEEIKHPERNIPKAVAYTLALSIVLYMAVAFVSLGVVGAKTYSTLTIQSSAPLQVIAEQTSHPFVAKILGFGAMTAMLGVLLNLILGLSRVTFAMSRRNDLPVFLTKVDAKHQSPYAAIVFSGLIILALILLKDIKATWSFSAFTVLIYYGLANAAALRMLRSKRLYSDIFPWLGLIGCFGISFWIEWETLRFAGLLIAVGLVWRGLKVNNKKLRI